MDKVENKIKIPAVDYIITEVKETINNRHDLILNYMVC